MIDEGYTKYQCSWRPGPVLPADAIEELNHWRNRLYAAGLVGYYAEAKVGFGNLSVRAHGHGEFIISGSQTGHIPQTNVNHYALVTAYDIDANQVSCEGPIQASSEALTHAAIYELDAVIGAIAHVHSPSLWRKLRHRVPTTAQRVPYGTPEMAREFKRLYRETELAETGIAVMAGHAEGIVTFGRTVAQAAQRIPGLAAEL